jgi:hypothetical protein
LAWTAFALILLGVVIRRRIFPTALVFQIYSGIQGLRQTAASGDDKLTPIRAAVIWTDTGGSALTDSIQLGPLQRLGVQSGRLLLRSGVVLLFIGVTLGALTLVAFPRGSVLQNTEDLGVAAVAFLVGVFALLRAIPLLGALDIFADEQGFRWKRPAFSGLGRRAVQASWQDARAFVMFRARRDSKSADVDEIFLLDTTTEALAWRITPKTPASVREAHERFVRMANEHVPLRDITASLKDLLASPETRSYEYAVTALSGSAPVPPAMRKVLTTPVRESHFLRGYLIVAAILLALLVAAGLLLQSGLIPAGSF